MSEAYPINVEMSLASDTIMLGEPMTLHYKMTNASEEEVDTYTGRDWKEWLIMRMQDEAGQIVPPVPDPRNRDQGGVFSDGIILSPGRQHEGFVTLTQRFALSHVGQHYLSVRVHLPYVAGPHQGIMTDQYEETFGTVLECEFQFSFTVTEADADRLRAIAATLREAVVLMSAPYEALGALFSMPEEYALPSWQTVAIDRRLIPDRQVIAGELERINSLAAAQILADMFWNPPPEVLASGGLMPAPAVTAQFYGLYSHASPPVKEYLDQTFRDHGREVPDVIPTAGG